MSQKISSLNAVAVIALVALLWVACGDEPSQSVPAKQNASADSVLTNPIVNDTSAWTAGSTTAARGDYVGTLVAVRTARHAGYDRIVFEFRDEELPNYHVEYIDRPVRACGSGEEVPLAGDGWLEIRLEPANAHEETGTPTILERNRTPTLPNLRELKQTCDFEAVVSWVAGVRSPNPYRVLELPNPTRLIIDLRH